MSGKWLHLKCQVLNEPERLVSLPDARKMATPTTPSAFYRWVRRWLAYASPMQALCCLCVWLGGSI